MSRIIVASALRGDGKSVVAAGLAGCLAASGQAVTLIRAAGDGAAADAQTFARVDGVGSGGQPVPLSAVPSGPGVVIVEVSNVDDARILVGLGGRAVLVVRAGEADDDTLGRAIRVLQPAGVVLTAVPEGGEDASRERITALGSQPLGVVPQDRVLMAPTIEAMAVAVGGVLRGDAGLYGEVTEFVQVGPISAHGGIDYFSRFPDKTVVVRRDRIDLALAALDQHPACLVVTGGEPTLPYIAQRAETEPFALIVTTLATPEAVARIGALYGTGNAFAGKRKIRRAAELITAQLDPALVGLAAPHA